MQKWSRNFYEEPADSRRGQTNKAPPSHPAPFTVSNFFHFGEREQTFALFLFARLARNGEQRYVATNPEEHGKPFSAPQISVRSKNKLRDSSE